MALRDLSIGTMLVITGAWLDPEKERPILERLTRVAPLLPDVEAAHEGLIRFQFKAQTASQKARSLMGRTTELDAEHDRMARGLHVICEGLALLAKTPKEAEAYLRLQAELMPTGLAIVTASYLEEAGQAELIDQRLSTGSKALLKSTKVHGKQLQTYVNEWKATARALGEAETEKARLLGEEATGSVGPARNAWTGAVTAVQHMLRREPDLTAAERHRLLEPLEAAQAKAAAAKKRAAAGLPVEDEGDVLATAAAGGGPEAVPAEATVAPDTSESAK